jgi:hypothetical protein
MSDGKILSLVKPPTSLEAHHNFYDVSEPDVGGCC